jgi:predicted HicB family RNase H-like nuclease
MASVRTFIARIQGRKQSVTRFELYVSFLKPLESNMSKSLMYKGYSAHIEFDPEDRIFSGRITGIEDIVTFHGETVDGLIQAFEEAVDDYLTMSQELGRPPAKPYSGRLMLRIPPEVHAQVAAIAAGQGKSLNAWAQEVLERAVSSQ